MYNLCVHTSIHPFIYLPMHPSFIYPSIHPSFHLCICKESYPELRWPNVSLVTSWVIEFEMPLFVFFILSLFLKFLMKFLHFLKRTSVFCSWGGPQPPSQVTLSVGKAKQKGGSQALFPGDTKEAACWTTEAWEGRCAARQGGAQGRWQATLELCLNPQPEASETLRCYSPGWPGL